MSERALNDAKIQLRDMLKEAKYPQARIFATQVLKNYGNDAELLYLRGTACAHRSATQQAEKDLRAAISLRPTCIDYYLTLCNLLFSTGKYEPAFSEYMRARNMAPHHPKIKAFTEIINGQNGKLNRELSKIESEYNATHYKVKIADQLVSLCLIKALFGWHVRHQGKSLLFFATNTVQIDDAAYYLDRIRSLPFLTNTGRQKRAKLENLIAVSRQRRFDGFISDRILPLSIVVIGVSVGGFIDLIYALSAIASFYAFMRPNYIFNRGRQKHGKDWTGRFRLLLDFAYGENIKPSNNIFSGISNYHYRQVVAGILRSLLRGTLMPISAYAGFYKNFNTKYAVVFAISIFLVAFVFAR